jgi:hypothetical protein
MAYQLREHLYACVIGEHAVFLDVEADRYFRLPEPLERAFVAHTAGPGDEPPPALLAHRILVSAGSRDDRPCRGHVDAPSRSALEMPDRAAGSGIGAIPEALALLWSCRRALRTDRFQRVLERTARERDQRCDASPRLPDPKHEQALLRATRAFLRARPYLPIAPCCLPDSLALTRFLLRRGLHARIVFGVTCEPFSAHCWVQVGDIALNETVGYARMHTVIRVL